MIDCVLNWTMIDCVQAVWAVGRRGMRGRWATLPTPSLAWSWVWCGMRGSSTGNISRPWRQSRSLASALSTSLLCCPSSGIAGTPGHIWIRISNGEAFLKIFKNPNILRKKIHGFRKKKIFLVVCSNCRSQPFNWHLSLLHRVF